jgi:hypothetical protein
MGTGTWPFDRAPSADAGPRGMLLATGRGMAGGANLPGVKVNLRTGFWPAWRARRHVEFRKPSFHRRNRPRFWIGARELGLNLIP